MSPPNAIVQTALSAFVSLYIKQPLAVNEAEVKLISAKSQHAVSVDKAVCVVAFGSDKTVSSGTFTIQFPAADASNAIVRIA